MCKIIYVTNRQLCRGVFLERIESIALSHPDGIILREKDMSEEEYTELAVSVLEICGRYDVPCTLHSFVNTASKLGAERIHLPLHILRELSTEDKHRFKAIGVSCHSVDDVEEAVSLGAGYVVAGHIYNTECKKGIAGRGLDFLAEICTVSSLPVYAIGGITAENIGEVISAGADGVCIMSGSMRCENTGEYMKRLRGGIN